jgi:hypothetical protein
LNIKIGFIFGDIGAWEATISGFNVAVSTSGNKTFSPF